MSRRLVRVYASCAAALLVTACGSGERPTLDRSARVTTTTAAAPTTVNPNANAATIADVKGSDVAVFAAPGDSRPLRTFSNPWFVNGDRSAAVPMLFLVTAQRGEWVEVLLPTRPNGSKAWVRAADVNLRKDAYRVRVQLAARHIEVRRGTTVLYAGTVAVGSETTPTPAGTYYIRVLIRSPSRNSPYGPFAYGLSGYSDVLERFDGGDAELGLHGNNDASVLGKNVTHGCIRMDNDAIARLAPEVPLGTPVEITA